MRDDELVHLRPQTYEVLKYLVEHRGELISKNKLIEDVWRGRAVTDGSLGKCIEELRAALGENSTEYVRNVRGRGYIFEAGVQEPNGREALSTRSEQVDVVRVTIEEHEELPDLAGPKALPLPLPASRAINRWKAATIAAGVLVLIVGGFAGYWLLSNRAAGRASIRSIAVMPFVNESGNPDVEYLSDGMTESVINSLSQLPGVKVIARSSSFKYKGKKIESQEVARALGVEVILTGRVLQRGENLLVSVELEDARDKTQIWGGQYNRKVTDLQAVQEEMARTISEKLRVKLTGAQEQQLTKQATENPAAYQLYLNGLFYHSKGEAVDIRKALDYYNQAVALDPNFALAWLGVARAYQYFAGNSLLDPKEALAKAKAAVEKALQLDEKLAEAHASMGRIKQAEWDWTGAEREFKRALELNPNLAAAHFRYSGFLSQTGRHTEALAEVKRAHEMIRCGIGCGW